MQQCSSLLCEYVDCVFYFLIIISNWTCVSVLADMAYTYEHWSAVSKSYGLPTAPVASEANEYCRDKSYDYLAI